MNKQIKADIENLKRDFKVANGQIAANTKSIAIIKKFYKSIEVDDTPEEIKTINFSQLRLPWEVKDDGDGYASLMDRDGATLAVGVQSEIADVITKIINSYQ